jgi:exopolysaccharide production protein ExoF
MKRSFPLFGRMAALCCAGLLSTVAVPTVAWAQTPGRADAYRLSVLDKVHVRVIEWSASSLSFEEWAEVGGTYTLGPDGTFAFPFVGNVDGVGKTPDEVEAALGQNLMNALGLGAAPDITIEVAEFGPIFVTGDVSNPGQFSFAPGMNVIKVMSLAGGRMRSDDEAARLEREALATKGALDVLDSTYQRVLVKRNRIAAEMAEKPDVATPEELASSAATDLVEIEQAIMDANVLRLSMNLDGLASQRAILTRELEALGQKRESATRQLASAQEQLEAITALAGEGLAVNSRVTSLETMVADIDGRLLDIDTAALRARQDLGGLDLRAVEIRSNRNSDLAVEMQQVEQELAELQLRIETQRALVREIVAQGALLSSGGGERRYSFTIVRGEERLPADETTALMPGDVVVARLELSGIADTVQD